MSGEAAPTVAVPAGTGDLTKPVASIAEAQARIASQEPGKAWHQDFFNPFGSPITCLMGYCCTPCLYGMNAQAVGQYEDCITPCISVYIASMCCLHFYFMQPTRSIIRKKYGLEEAPQSDCISTTVLCCFSVCQEAAELEFQKTNAAAPVVAATDAPVPQTM